MARTTSTDRTVTERVSSIARRTTRYDLVLAVIPASFVVALLAWATAVVPLTTAAGVASGIGLLAVMDALFFNPPREPTARPPDRLMVDTR